jgi:hypothetical protein
MADFYLVEVNAIHSSESVSNFNQTEIDKLARLILDANGLLRPLILKKTGLEQYEVVSGHLEYYAAIRAKERDVTKAEMVNALVIEAEAETAVAQQIQFLEQLSTANPSDTSQVTVLDSLASNLEDMFARQLQTMTQRLESNLQTISNQIPKQTKPIDTFNQLGKVELARRLMTVGIKGKNLEKIVDQILSKRPFQTLPEVVEKVNGLSEKKMVELIDTLSNLIFG